MVAKTETAPVAKTETAPVAKTETAPVAKTETAPVEQAENSVATVQEVLGDMMGDAQLVMSVDTLPLEMDLAINV